MTTSEIRKIPYTKPSITELEVQYATAAPIVHLGAKPVFVDICRTAGAFLSYARVTSPQT